MKRLPVKITFCHVIVIIHILLDTARQLCYEYYIHNTEVKRVWYSQIWDFIRK